MYIKKLFLFFFTIFLFTGCDDSPLGKYITDENEKTKLALIEDFNSNKTFYCRHNLKYTGGWIIKKDNGWNYSDGIFFKEDFYIEAKPKYCRLQIK